MVKVDELQVAPKSAPRCFARGFCHLSADSVEELHRFASRLGLRRAWFQPSSYHPHYDLTAGKRVDALLLGAAFVPARQQARERLERKRAEERARPPRSEPGA